jgi:urea carboxylase-associated protein 2
VSETASTAGAREHARAQAGTVVEAMPTIPASLTAKVPSGVDPRLMTWAETVAGGGYTSKVLARGTRLRLLDLTGDACAHVLLFNADQPWERLNVADTVKIPWQAYLGPAHPLLSDQGRVLATIVGDYSNSASDALCGTSTRSSNEARYGHGAASSSSPAGLELLRLAAAKHGLTHRDIPPSISFFKRVRVTEAGELHYTNSCYPGGHFDLRAELPLIVLIANVPHPLDPRPQYTCTPLDVLAWRGMATTPADPLWSFSPELERAYLNTADYVYARAPDD